jgi:hypothetical protein
LNENFQKEKEKINTLDRNAKMTYLWDYYKIPIVGAVVFVLLIIYFCYVVAVRPGETVFYASFVNSYADIEEGSDFYNAYVEYAGIDTKEYTVKLEVGSYFDLSSGGSNNVYYQKTVAIVESGMADVIVCDYDNYYNLAASGRFLSLEDESVADIYNAYSERILSVKHAETGEEAKVAVDVSDSKWFKELNTYENGAVVLVSPNAPHKEKIKGFIDFLLTE